MSAHRVQVRAYVDGEMRDPGDVIPYTGPPSWVYEPVDADARSEWVKTHADPEQVRTVNWLAAGRLRDPLEFDPDYEMGVGVMKRPAAPRESLSGLVRRNQFGIWGGETSDV